MTSLCPLCTLRILMVDGDHRVAIMTNRELREGEEIFYNYNYDKRVREPACLVLCAVR